jgi:hypothetical protein
MLLSPEASNHEHLTHDQAIKGGVDPYLDPYESCLMRLIRLLDVLGERG